jgi:hypothetical protein
VRHLTGVTDAERQKLREEVLGTTREDFSTLGEALSRMGDQQPVVALVQPMHWQPPGCR